MKYFESTDGEKKDTWSIYAYHKGNHAVESDEALEKSRGGSHGVGKIASNAASDLYTMFFANCDADGNQHLGGTVQLIEHKYKNNYYRATGYFTDQKVMANGKTDFIPYKNTFGPVFSKKTRGLKIIIPFFREQFNDEKQIIQCICDNFFIAILQNKLQVSINGNMLTKETIANYILDPDYYEQETALMKDKFTPLYYLSYTQYEPILLKVKDRRSVHEFQLYYNYDQNITKGRVAIVRTIGMKIEDYKVKGNATKPFNAVLIPTTTDEDMFLKSLENESHTELSWEHFKDLEAQGNAKRFLNNLSKEIAAIIDESIRKNNQTDGILNTDDIIYDMETQFKKELSKSVSTVQLVKGKKEIVQVGGKKKKKEDGKVKGLEIPKGSKETPNPKPNKTKTKRVKPEPNEEEREKDKFSAHPSEVERVIIGKNEMIKFDFSLNEEIKATKQCDISVAVVDGMGEILKNEFEVQDNYLSAVDLWKGTPLKIKENKILDASIHSGVVKMKLSLKDSFNKALKFVYFVEV